ncbi:MULTISPECIES: DUF262 domain-containing protein [Mesoplasma]|uniref:DUF262 domain-containing protein n=1 Tax=Mesoplasma florum TaxID=2151 RepID=A0A2R3P7A1_MESFO|nr:MULTISPECIES: DUF262 domain-containing protein [Mesoplasma]AVN64363.1 DUF262 domain-containing protein [Mesoplasma florum]
MEVNLFKKFYDYLSPQERLDLKIIETKISSEQDEIANNISIEVSKILESKMNRILEENQIYLSIYEKTSKVIFDKICYLYSEEKKLESGYRKNTQIPKIIFSTFYYIRNWRNDEGHPSEIGIKRSFADTIHLVKCFDLVLSFLINFFNDSDFMIDDFDEDFLLKILNQRKHFIDEIIDENKKADVGSIKLGKIDISSFVLNPEINFFIPSYQRKYRWDSETCKELVNGILKKANSIDDEYFGTIAVTIEENTRNNDVRTVRLIDGQQRVTTSLIIFRVIFDLWKEKQLNSYEENILEMPNELQETFVNVGCSNKYKNVTGNQVENKSIDFILNENLSYNERKTKITNFETIGKSQVAKNYFAIHDMLVSLSQDELSSFYQRYAYKFLISCVDFNKTPAEEMEIFETLNSKGTELDSFDMIKNFLFNLVDKDIFLEKEEEITKIFNEYISFDDLKIEEDKKRKVQEAFLFSYCEYKLLEFKQSDNNLSKNKKSILKHFKKIYETKNNIDVDEFKKIVSEIGKYVLLAKSFESKNYENNTYDLLFPLRYNIANIAHKDISLFIIFYIIDVFAKNKWDSYSKTINYKHKLELMKNTLFEFEKWIISLLQVSGTGQSLTKPILRLFRFLNFFDTSNRAIQEQIPNMIKKWLSMEEENSFTFQSKEQKKLLLENIDLKIPTSEQLYNSLISKKVQDKNIAMVLLKRLESKLINNWEIKRDKNSLEHIMPKTIKKTKWIDYLKDNNLQLNDKEIFDKHAEYIDKIGNYLILDKNKENSKLSNAEFSLKRMDFEKWNNPLCTLIFNFSSNANLLTTEKFGFKEIDERSKAISKIIVEEIYFKNN